MSNRIWIVSLNDGTFVELDSLPVVVEVEKKYLQWLDENRGGNFPLDGDDEWNEAELMGGINTHIHIKDLVENSHWADHEDVRGTNVEFLDD